jgi:hypothetical protein
VSKKPTEASVRRKGQIQSKTPQDTAFRRWLEEQLHQKYDDILNEPIPDDLLSLLKPEDREDRSK